MAQFSERMVTEVVQQFWAAMARGEFITGAAAEAGTYRVKGARWWRAEGGVRPRRGRDLKGRCLSFSEREEIAVARARGESMRAIARRLGRSPSTVSRELARNAGGTGGYRATTAHALRGDASPSSLERAGTRGLGVFRRRTAEAPAGLKAGLPGRAAPGYSAPDAGAWS